MENILTNKVLCSDLIWRYLSELTVGQKIIGFDENPNFDEYKAATRKYKEATITQTKKEKSILLKIKTENNFLIIPENNFVLVFVKNRKLKDLFLNQKNIIFERKYPRSPGLIWKKAKDLTVNDELAFMTDPWAVETSKESGWLEGIFDGEGSLSRSTVKQVRIPAWKINISQNPGITYDRIKGEITQRNFTFYENIRACPQIVLTGGWSETLRFLGSIRPARLLLKLPLVVSNMPKLIQTRTYKNLKIQQINNLGVQTYYDCITDSKTCILNGFLCHC